MTSACNLGGGTECVEHLSMKWKDKGEILKDIEGSATRPLD